MNDTKVLHCEIPETLHAEMRVRAAQDRQTTPQVVVAALRLYLAQEPKKAAKHV